MTTIETVYAVLAALLTEFGDKRGYKAASDPFSFDSQPRSDFNAFYIDPPATRSTGYTSGVENVEAAITIWVSREAGEDAAGAAVALAGDLARLRHLVIGLDFDAAGDVNVHESVDAVVQPRRERGRGGRGRPARGVARLRHRRGASVVLRQTQRPV